MSPEPIAFGPFELDGGRRLLASGSAKMPLTVRGAAILGALLEASGEVVSRQVLMERAWPSLTLEDSNLAVQVSTLRKSLDALQPGAADWIVTVPRTGYRLIVPERPVAPRRRYGPTVAVLPFDNFSAEPDHDYFCSGLVEELTTALSRFRDFVVVSRASAFAWRDRKSDYAGLARALGTDYVLDGSVRRTGNRVRVATHLVETASGTQLWADRFDGVMADVFDVEDEITDAVISRVEPQIRKAEIERVRRRRPDSLNAYDLYLQALPHLHAEPARWVRALELLRRAIALDPTYAPALAMAAWMHEKRIREYMPFVGPDDTAEALDFARRAADADPEDASALAIAGWVPIALAGEFDAGIEQVRRGTEMNPNNLFVLNVAGMANIFGGDLDEARDCYLRAYSLSPGAPDAYWSLTGLAQIHLTQGEYEDAIAWAEHSLTLNPLLPVTLGVLADSYALSGRLDEARAMMAQLMAIKPSMTVAMLEGRHLRDRRRWESGVQGSRLAGMPEGEWPPTMSRRFPGLLDRLLDARPSSED